MRAVCPEISRKKVELDLGEAEAAAIAATRGWTFLTDDQASVELLRCLYPNVPIQRTCTLLLYAAEQGVLSCEEAANRFNSRIVEELGSGLSADRPTYDSASGSAAILQNAPGSRKRSSSILTRRLRDQ